MSEESAMGNWYDYHHAIKNILEDSWFPDGLPGPHVGTLGQFVMDHLVSGDHPMDKVQCLALEVVGRADTDAYTLSQSVKYFFLVLAARLEKSAGDPLTQKQRRELARRREISHTQACRRAQEAREQEEDKLMAQRRDYIVQQYKESMTPAWRAEWARRARAYLPFYKARWDIDDPIWQGILANAVEDFLATRAQEAQETEDLETEDMSLYGF